MIRTPRKQRLAGVVGRFRRRSQHHRSDPEDPRDENSGRVIDDLFDRLVADAVERGADADHITAALDQATQAAGDVLAERLLADAPRMLREHRNFRHGFEQRLQQRWGPALDRYVTIRVCCLEAGEEFHQGYQQQNDDSDPKHQALTLLHARACLGRVSWILGWAGCRSGCHD